MAFSEFEIIRVEKIVSQFIEKRRPAPEIRNKLDLGYRLRDQSVEIFEIRPAWNNPDKIIESPLAKTTYIKAKNIWKVLWRRADLKWHSYDPKPYVKTIEEFLALVDQDKHACFFG
jgi:hypothetical protein